MTKKSKRAIVYLDAAVHRALRFKAAETEQSLSDLVNSAVRESLREDAEDLETFDARANEPSVPFDRVLDDV